MPRNSYLARRASGVYFIRLCVPRVLQRAVGKTELHRSTGCRDLTLAKVVGSALVAQWHEALGRLQHMDIKKVASGSLDLLGEGFLPLAEAAALIGSNHGQLIQRLIERRASFYVMADRWDGWWLQDVEDLHHDRGPDGLTSVDISESQLYKHGTQAVVSKRLALRFASEVEVIAAGSGGLEVCQFLLPNSKSNAFIVPLPGTLITLAQLEVRRVDVEALRATMAMFITEQMVDAADQERAERVSEAQASIAAQSAPEESIANRKYRGMRLSELIQTYLRRHQESWRPNTLHTNTERCGLLVELTNDPTLGEIDQDTCWLFSEQAARLPHDRHLAKVKYDCLDATYVQLIELADKHKLKRLSPQALKKLVSGVGEVFSWSMRVGGQIKSNPFANLADQVYKATGAKPIRLIKSRDLFTVEDLSQIFSAVWFQNGAGAKTKAGNFYAYRPHYYWLPLLAIYCGGRLNELSQLYLDDIAISPAGNPYFDFNLSNSDKISGDADDAVGDGDSVSAAVDDKTLKSINSERQVPVHSVLVDLGLLDYVEALRRAGHSRLFPELKHDAVKGYGKAAGKWFNDRYLGGKLKMERDGRKTFHSFRHTYATAVGRAEISPGVKSQLLGHSKGRSTTDSTYDKGLRSSTLSSPIRLIIERGSM